jgi:hypothetical protein
MKNSSFYRQIQILIEEYSRNVAKGKPVNPREIAAWLLRTKKCAPSAEEAVTILARHVANAMRTQVVTTPEGWKVRRKHCVRYKETAADGSKFQLPLWYDMEIAPPQFMLESFQQRRGSLAGGSWQLKKDVDYYNKTYNKAAPIQVHFDFTEDIADREASGGDYDSADDDDDSVS